MASNAVNTALQMLWREKLNIVSLKDAMVKQPEIISSSKFIEQLVNFTFCGSTQNSLFVKHIKEGLAMEFFSPAVVVDCLAKLSLGTKLKCYVPVVEVIESCMKAIRCDPDLSPCEVCKTATKATYWLLQGSIEIYKFLYVCMKDPSVLSHDPDFCFQVICKCQNALNKLLFTKEYEDLNFVGKLLSGEEEATTLQVQMRDLLSFQLEEIKSHNLYRLFESELKEFVKYISRFLNSTPMFTQVERPHGQVPCKTLHTLVQFQVLQYFSSEDVVEIIDMLLKLENIPVDQVLSDLFHFAAHNILVSKDFELTIFTGFMFLKLPTIIHHLDEKYKVHMGDKSIFSVTCQQILQAPLNDLDNILGCNSLKLFLNQCQQMKVIDAKTCEHLIKSQQQLSPVEVTEKPDCFVNKMLFPARNINAILNNLSIEESKDKNAQELTSLINSTDLITFLVICASNDSLKLLIDALLRINMFSSRCPEGTLDASPDLRADMFNNSFLLLAYIDTTFGDKVFLNVSVRNSFFMVWRTTCLNVTSRKMYTQSVLDSMMEPILTSYCPSTSNACWDEYCWSVGMIVKELTQAHLRRHINTDTLQKVCENFKNKRPALCISAVTWLCVQYKTMPVTERSRTIKLIKLFKRPHINPVRANLLSPVLNKYSAILEVDLQTANVKGKSVQAEHPTITFSALVADLSPAPGRLLFHQAILAKINDCYKTIGSQSFAEACIKLILESGKEEEAKLYEDTCTCLILMHPFELLKEIFTTVLKSMFHCSNIVPQFADPQGLCLAKCLSRAFSISLILYDTSNNTKGTTRPAKMAKLSNPPVSDREKLVQYFSCFCEDAGNILSTKEANAVSAFIVNIIEQTAMSAALLKQPIRIQHDRASRLLEQLPYTISRDTVIFLCNLTTIKGQETAAKYFIQQSSAIS